jgi:hypothetical protein
MKTILPVVQGIFTARTLYWKPYATLRLDYLATHLNFCTEHIKKIFLKKITMFPFRKLHFYASKSSFGIGGNIKNKHKT